MSDSPLFEPIRIGGLEARNRFVRAATYEGMARRDGEVTDALVELHKGLARGGIGTLITGYLWVSRSGRGPVGSTGIDSDERIKGLTRLARAMRSRGSLAVFQLQHSGEQTSRLFTGSRPVGPSGCRRDPMTLGKGRALDAGEIAGIVADFAAAAGRAREAGADAVQLHAAHGYLLSQFLSPFFNRRDDGYGGGQEGRFRLLGEVVEAMRAAVGEDFPVLVKINVEDGTPGDGVDARAAVYTAGRLAELGIAALEISAGATHWSPFTMCRGAVPAGELARAVPWPLRPLLRRRFEAMEGAAPFVQRYNAYAAPGIKQALGDVPLALVGGLRTRAVMEETVDEGRADLISLGRPLIREPLLVQRLREGTADEARCVSCNLCLAAVARRLPLRCYVRGIPAR